MKIQRKEILNMLEKDNFCPHCGHDFPRGWELLMEAFEKEKSEELRVIRRKFKLTRRSLSFITSLVALALLTILFVLFNLSFFWCFIVLLQGGMLGALVYVLTNSNSAEQWLWKEFVANHFSTLKDRDRAG